MTALTLAEIDAFEAWADMYWHNHHNVKEVCAAARAHLTSQAWREISTAPKVSQHLLMFGDGRGFEQCIFVGRWKDDEFGGQWVLAFDGRAAAPTHWMSLPPTPNTNGERDGQSLEAISRGTHDRNSPSAGDHRPIKAGEGVAVAGNQRAHQRAEQGIRPLEEAGGAATERSSGEPIAAPAITEGENPYRNRPVGRNP
jgi:hypothetical protein